MYLFIGLIYLWKRIEGEGFFLEEKTKKPQLMGLFM